MEPVTLDVQALETHLTAIAEATHAALALLRTPRKPPTTDQLYGTVEELITLMPRKFSELKLLTHATDNALKSVLIRLQRDNPMCVNLGGRKRALWAIVTPDFLERLRGK